MIISVKDSLKLAGISIVCFCAVFVCALFINYYIDLQLIEDEIINGQAKILYDAQLMTCRVVCGASGGSLSITSVVLLVFYIKHYIDTHNKELGILKALGYSNLRIAAGFGLFGLSVFAGTSLGYLSAFIAMPALYQSQNKDGYLPEVLVNFHIGPMLFFVVVPAIVFAMLAIIFSLVALKIPALDLIRGKTITKVRKIKDDEKLSFLKGLKISTTKQRKSLVFFIAFGSFCFSAMTQMSFSMKDLATEMIGVMIMVIGIILACVTLFIALTSVMKANSKTVTIMKVFGYSAKDCSSTIFGGYRIWNYLGFFLGSVYQYALLKIMVTIVFKDMEGVPDYKFDFKVCFMVLVVYVLLYEMIMKIYARRMGRLSVKEIMLD